MSGCGMAWQPSLSSQDLCQFLEIHACIRKPDLHLHPGFSVLLCISETMVLFGCSKDPLYGLLPLLVQFLHPQYMTDVLRHLHVWLPYMPGDDFHVVPAGCTLCQVRTAFTDGPTALVFPVPVPVRRTVFQRLSVRAHITVVVLVIRVFVLPEETFLCHGTFIRKQWPDPVIDQHLCDRRCLVSGIHDHRLYPDIPDLIVQDREGDAVMLVAGMHAVSEDPSVLVTGRLHTVGKDLFVFPFMEPTTLRVCRTYLDLFVLFTLSL